MKRLLTAALALSIGLVTMLVAQPASAVTRPSAPAQCAASSVSGGDFKVTWSRPSHSGGAVVWRYTIKVKGQRHPVVRLDSADRTTTNQRRRYTWAKATHGDTPLRFKVRATTRAGAGDWCTTAPIAPVRTARSVVDTVDTTSTDGPFVPYGENSFLQSEVTGAPVSESLTSGFHSFMKTHPDQKSWPYPVIRGVGGNMWGSVFGIGTSSDPLWTIRNHAGYGKKQTSVLMTKGFHAPEWLGDLLTGTSDSPFAIIDRADGFTVRGDKAVYAGNHQIDILTGGATAITYHSSNGLDRRDPQSDDARNFMSRGRISEAMIRRDLVGYAIKHDTDLGHVLHLYLAETLTSAGFVHPMVGAESGKEGWGAEGVRIAIDPSVDLSKRGLSPAGLVVARTLQKYGAYVGDNAGTQTALQAEVEKPGHPVWDGLLTRDSLKGITWDDFVVIKPGWQ